MDTSGKSRTRDLIDRLFVILVFTLISVLAFHIQPVDSMPTLKSRSGYTPEVTSIHPLSNMATTTMTTIPATDYSDFPIGTTDVPPGTDPLSSAMPLYPDWMRTYPDETRISTMNIPGTHNSMALYGYWSTCQTMNLHDQYNGGIRFVDIRCRQYGDDLPIHHDIVYQHASFTNDVVKSTNDFLASHPSETIIMLIKFENHMPMKGTLEFNELVRNCLNIGAPNIWLDTFPDTLGEARGKIIVMNQDWPSGEPTLGRSLKSVHLENSWQEHNVDKKWAYVTTGLEAAFSGPSTDMYVTFSSGYVSFFWFPYVRDMSSEINPKLHNFLEKSAEGRYGVIAMDFPWDHVSLIGTIIGLSDRHMCGYKQDIAGNLTDWVVI